MKINCHDGWFKGLGDIVCFAWIGQAMKSAGHDVVFYASGWRADVLQMFQMKVTDDSVDAAIPIHGYEEAVAANSPLSYVEWLAKQCGAPIMFERPRADIDPMPRTMGRKASAEVLLCPEGVWVPRIWPRVYWIDLAQMFKDAGVHVKVVTEFPDTSFSFLHYIAEEPLPLVAAALQRAKLVIGNDSGPAHLAGTLGTRTLAIQGPTTERIFAHIPEVTCLRKISLGCGGCHCLPSKVEGELGWRQACNFGCGELYRTLPEDVFAMAMKLLGKEKLKAA